MSDEIYVGSKPSGKGCLILVGIIAAFVLALGFGIWKWRRGSSPEPLTPASTPQTTAPTTAPEVDPGAALLAEALKLKEENKLLEAREKAYEALEQARRESTRAEIIKLLGDINITLVFSPHPMPEKVDYVVQPGNTLVVLARRFGTTVDAIRKGNRLTGSTIRVNDRLRILTGKFRIVVSKSRNTLDLYLNDRLFKQYRVGTGEYGRTPTGEFTITEKIPQPTWWRPDGKAIPYGHPENVLGTHWLSLNAPGYGIHGTWEPETIGKQASAGCIRLLNSDVEELFMLVPEGTPVTITE